VKPGDLIADRFVIDRLAASGGMGSVWRAVDRHTDGLAALKIVPADDAHALERFAREARVLAELRHPGIVRYLAHGRSADGDLFLAMEWLDGEDLATHLSATELSVADSVTIATQAAAALAVAHARQIIHRDVKPSNLFLVDDDPRRIKLLDFGVARMIRMDSVTASGYLVGTPIYMAPEQLRGSRDLDARADVFALGMVLYRCLTGRPPFTGASIAEVLQQIQLTDPPPMRDLAPKVPPELATLVEAMLAKEPERRPRDAGAVLAALVGFDVTTPGARLRPERAELGSAERRVQTVVVVASPPLAALRAAAAAHGARLEDATGRQVAVVAAQRVATDQVQRAARLALALHRAAPEAPTALVTGRGELGQLLERAEQLLGEASAPGQVRLDEVSAGMLSARFEVAAGLGLVGEREADEAPRTLLGVPTPFVGRDRELALLEGVVADAIENGSARALLVTAPAGTGKSRLRQELVRRLRDRTGGAELEIWLGYGDPMRAGAPFTLLGDAVRRVAGIQGGEPLPERQRLLGERVARCVAPADAARITAFLGEIANVPFAVDERPLLRAARRDPALLADQTRAAFEEWLDAECAERPVVIVLEDLHWGDVPTVKLVDGALGALAERPLVVVGLARPEVHDLFPRIWAGRGLEELHLGALPRKAAERLVRAALGSEVAGDTVAALVSRAQGNAFVLEELVRQVASGRTDAAPETVLAMIAARFEAMEAEARRVLRAASVFGETFWAGGVEALCGGTLAQPLEHWLGELKAREVVAGRPRSRFGGEPELGFRHSLLRDAAYAMLTDEDRALGHRLAGAWLERAGEPEAAVLADHFERGGEPERAAALYERAAGQALAGGDPAKAVALADRGLRCGGARGPLLLVQAEAERARGDHPAAERRAFEAMASLERGSDAWFVAVGESVAAAGKLFHLDVLHGLGRELDGALGGAAEPTAKQAVALARAAAQGFLCGEVQLGEALLARFWPPPAALAEERGVMAWIQMARAYRAFGAADFVAGEAHGNEASRLFDESGDRRNACVESIQAALSDTYLGRFERALEAWARLIPHAEELGLIGAAAMARAFTALTLAWRGGAADAVRVVDEAFARAPGLGQPRVVCLLRVARGLGVAGLGQDALAESELVAAAGMGLSAYPPILWAWGFLALFLADRGRHAEALEHAEHALELGGARRFVANAAEILLARVVALEGLGRDARAARAEARAFAEGLLAQVPESPLRIAAVARLARL
jgi:tetratricopeptide (TPR) repeat protein